MNFKYKVTQFNLLLKCLVLSYQKYNLRDDLRKNYVDYKKKKTHDKQTKNTDSTKMLVEYQVIRQLLDSVKSTRSFFNLTWIVKSVAAPRCLPGNIENLPKISSFFFTVRWLSRKNDVCCQTVGGASGAVEMPTRLWHLVNSTVKKAANACTLSLRCTRRRKGASTVKSSFFMVYKSMSFSVRASVTT